MTRPLSIADAARELAAPERTVRAWAAAGHLPGAYRVGTAWLIPPQAVRKFRRPEMGRPKKK
jgi:excisionase family DNA binding protein